MAPGPNRIALIPSLINLLLLAGLAAGPAAGKARSRDGVPPRAEKHYRLRLAAPPRQADRALLENSGLHLVQPNGDEWIVRTGEGNVDPLLEWTLKASLREEEPEYKLARSALAEWMRSPAAPRLRVLFYDDIDFPRARRIIESAGGFLANPLDTEFGITRTINAIVPWDAMRQLAEADAVFQIHGRRPRITAWNAGAALLSEVTPLYSAPYGLSGAGVSVSVWDCGNAQADHPEFQGRLTTHSNAEVGLHPTHVSGTIGAAGINAGAKGMAPAVRIHQWDLPCGDSTGEGYLDAKRDNFGPLSLRADNNSWGFQLGWEFESSSSMWKWYGGTQLFGGYDLDSAAFDKLARDNDTLMVFSSGNDNGDGGPTSAPFAHEHDGDSETWCYSADGSGSDCPPTPCTRCEIARHAADGPYGSVGPTGSSKNVIATGAVFSTGGIASFSSGGPTRDGRVKPDLVAKGVAVLSTEPGNNYGRLQGTSMAAPVVTGIAALLVEQWSRTFGSFDPPTDVLRALLIAGAKDLGNPGPDYNYGFGLVDAKNSVDLIIADGATGSRIQTGTVSQGVRAEIPMVLSADRSARVTLTWNDPQSAPFASSTVVNDLDLRVIGPSGEIILPYVLDPANPGAPATRGPNRSDLVKQVEIRDGATGTYLVQVTGQAIRSGTSQRFAIVTTGAFGPAAPPCGDPYEPNDSDASAWGGIIPGGPLSARICGGTDRDLFKFTANRSGIVSVRVTATDTPLRLTLSGPSGSQSASIPAGLSGSVQTVLGTGTNLPVTATTFLVEVVPDGAVVAEGRYTMAATYGVQVPLRRRGVRPR